MTAEIKVSASSTWNQIGGCELEKAIEVQITHEDIFYKPPIDEILHEERAVLLADGQNGSACELQLKIFPDFKFSSIHLLCSVPKMELFFGPLREYNETVYGTVIESEEDDLKSQTEMGDGDCTVRSFRYDIEIVKSGVVEMTLKFLAASSEICIFGFLILIGPNPNGITTLLPNATIDLGNVNEMLNSSKQKLSPNAEKCKLFMEMYNKSKQSNNNPSLNSTDLLNQMKHMMSAHVTHPNSQETDHHHNIQIEQYIDKKIQELEQRLTTRLDNYQELQCAKLDAILQKLQNLPN